MSIAYCNTEHMPEDFFTKSLQGCLFVRFHDVIMGWKQIDTLHMVPPLTKKNVGDMDEDESRKKAKEKYMGKKKFTWI